MSRFRARLDPVPHGGCFVVVPPEVARRAGVAYRDRVCGLVDGSPYRSALMKYSGLFHLGVPKAPLAAAGASLGDEVAPTIEVDREPLPADVMPDDPGRALPARPAAAAGYAALSPAHKRMRVGLVLPARRPETRAQRIEKVVAALASAARTTSPARH